MVFQARIEGTHPGFSAGVHYLPADRCVWEYASPATGGYSEADGNYVVQQVILYRDADAVTFERGSDNVTSLLFGTIGKSGRFVAMTTDG